MKTREAQKLPSVLPAWQLLKSYPTEEGRGNYLRMDFNEGPPPPEEILTQALALCAHGITAYPEYDPLKKAAAIAFGIEKAGIMTVNGGDEGISILMRAFVGKDRPLLAPFPTFAMYGIYAAQCEALVIQVPMGSDFAFEPEALIREIPNAAAIALCSPNNPTGQAIPETDILRVLEAAGNKPVILDELYAAYCHQDFSVLMRRHPNLLLIRSLSKSHGVPGLRCGFILARPELIAQIEPLRPPFNVNAVAALVGAHLLDSDKAIQKRLAMAVVARKEVQSTLQAAGIRCIPSDAHFFMAELGERCAEAVNYLKTRGILIKQIGALPSFVRISLSEPSHARAFLESFLPWWTV